MIPAVKSKASTFNGVTSAHVKEPKYRICGCWRSAVECVYTDTVYHKDGIIFNLTVLVTSDKYLSMLQGIFIAPNGHNTPASTANYEVTTSASVSGETGAVGPLSIFTS